MTLVYEKGHHESRRHHLVRRTLRVAGCGGSATGAGSGSGTGAGSPRRRAPAIIGFEFAGVVEAVGPGVVEGVVGDRVAGWPGLRHPRAPTPSTRSAATSRRSPTAFPSRRPRLLSSAPTTRRGLSGF
ncbi:alcohol dehydrogenase catalytic domain-containing protein [Streptomyces carpaticus]|uniref:alcohol dehydrogenase catalytic domain-containing protein n=1 Tax=Streptomyces carpaticus TaxID=285558 RepID=UPI0031FA2AAB